MTVGERIKKIRTFRGMIQCELGEKLGYKGKNQAVRVALYEKNYRVPKKDTVMEIAKILNYNYVALKDYNLGAAEDIIETLFWLEENTADEIILFEMIPNKKTPFEIFGGYNEDHYLGSPAPIGITFNY